MLSIARILAAASLLLAAAALTTQVLRAWGGGRKDWSERSGSALRGAAYFFTVGMLPSHKESATRHPAEFAVGLVMHLGVLAALAGVILLAAGAPAAVPFLGLARPVVVLALAAGIVLLVRRTRSRTLRAMTSPDDFIAIAATCVWLLLTALATARPVSQVALLLFATVLFLYAPLGKLRHAAFFWAARADYGRRLGRRGVFPPRAATKEPIHARRD